MGIIVNVPNRGLARKFAKAISKSKFGYCTTIEQWARGNFSHEPTNLTKARIPANKKKKYYPGVFFKTASKKRRFVHHYAFVCIIFVF